MIKSFNSVGGFLLVHFFSSSVMYFFLLLLAFFILVIINPTQFDDLDLIINSDTFNMAYDGICMQEFVMSLEQLKHDYNVSALDVAKAMLDYGIHPPTMYFPLIVHEALMVEPTETEGKAQMDEAIKIYKEIYKTESELHELFLNRNRD